jgi:phage-related tail fiber protein
MANDVRIKRRDSSGAPGAPSSLLNAELAFNEADDTLYYGKGTGGAGGTATTIVAIAGKGGFVDKGSDQTIGGNKTFSNTVTASVTGNAGTATKLETARDLSLTGDASATISAFDGSANVSATLTLATTGVTAGAYTKVTTDAKGRITLGETASLSELSVPTTNVAFNGYKITGLADPTADQDAATKIYVDSVAQGLNVKAAVKASTTTNITLSGSQTIDGVSVTPGDRVLVKAQTLAKDNGIYIANSSTWTRATDADTWADIVSAFVFVEQGSTLGNSGWVCTADAGGTLGTTAINWVQFSAAGAYAAGTGLTLDGNIFKLSDTTVTAGAYGSASKSVSFTVNAQGQLTTASEADISLDCGTF